MATRLWRGIFYWFSQPQIGNGIEYVTFSSTDECKHDFKGRPCPFDDARRAFDKLSLSFEEANYNINVMGEWIVKLNDKTLNGMNKSELRTHIRRLEQEREKDTKTINAQVVRLTEVEKSAMTEFNRAQDAIERADRAGREVCRLDGVVANLHRELRIAGIARDDAIEREGHQRERANVYLKQRDDVIQSKLVDAGIRWEGPLHDPRNSLNLTFDTTRQDSAHIARIRELEQREKLNLRERDDWMRNAKRGIARSDSLRARAVAAEQHAMSLVEKLTAIEATKPFNAFMCGQPVHIPNERPSRGLSDFLEKNKGYKPVLVPAPKAPTDTEMELVTAVLETTIQKVLLEKVLKSAEEGYKNFFTDLSWLGQRGTLKFEQRNGFAAGETIVRLMFSRGPSDMLARVVQNGVHEYEQRRDPAAVMRMLVKSVSQMRTGIEGDEKCNHVAL